MNELANRLMKESLYQIHSGFRLNVFGIRLRETSGDVMIGESLDPGRK